MSKGSVKAPEQEKGHYAYKVLLINAKKKHMDALLQHLNAMEQSGKLTVLAKDQTTKTKMLRSYEQAKVLLAAAEDDLNIPDEVSDPLDYFAVSQKAGLEIQISTFKEVDVWLKWNIKEQTAQFQLRGGQLDVREVKEKQANGAVLRTCHYTMRGEMRSVIQYRDRMMENKYADPKSFKYTFWTGDKK